MMESVRSIVSIVADLGVVAGFVLIAIQLEQNSTALSNQAQATIAASYTAAETALIGDSGSAAFSKSVTDPKNMSPEEVTAVWVYYSSSFAPIYTVHEAYKNRTLTQDEYMSQINSFAVYITTPFARAWWKSASLMFPEEAVNDLNKAIAEFPDRNFLANQLNTIQLELAKADIQ